jgi:NADH dehydrogenase [ubiquinone] 1 alpha subcomplex assembly factor 7
MADDRPPLEAEIRRLIAVAGPMPLAEYMRLAMTDPQYGYYVTRDPIGASGDFITAPEVSQMFGELIGLWMVAVWQQMGAPENVRIVELGPGRGTMMCDALRAAKIVEEFQPAIVLHLVEISPKLQQMQQRLLEPVGVPLLWHKAFSDIPAGPCIVVANEFIDALPVHQAIKQGDGWHERVVAIGPEGNLVMSAAPEPLPHFEGILPGALRNCAEGSIYEWRADRLALELGKRVRTDGAALIIDYGHAQHGLGETLQAVAGHSFADPLRAPGEADLTAHVDFRALAQSAEMLGARVHGPVGQGNFLRRLGIERRAAALKARATAEKAAEVDAALARLTAAGSGGMGELFKVLAIADPRLGQLPGFDS